MSRLSSLSICLAASLAACGDPAGAGDEAPLSSLPGILSPEVFSTPPVYQPLAANVTGASMARGPAVDLVVWSDTRRGERSAADDTGPDLYAARVNHAGQVLDIPGIPISKAPRSQMAPAVAFDGANFLVVWQDFRDDLHYIIYGARVTPAGVLLDPDGFPISSAPGTAPGWDEQPQVASNGTVSWVVWRRSVTNNPTAMDILGARVSQSGAVLDSVPRVVSAAASGQDSPSIASGAGGFFAVWGDCRNCTPDNFGFDIYGTRLTAGGQVLDPAGIPISVLPNVYESGPKIAFGGTSYFVSWRQQGTEGNAVFAARVSTAGALLDPTGIQVVSTLGGYKPGLAMDSDGSRMWIAWHQIPDQALYAVRLDANGSPVDAAPLALASSSGQKQLLGLVFNGVNMVALWNQFQGSWQQLLKTRITLAGAMLDPQGTIVAHGANMQSAARVAAGAQGGLVVWVDSAADSSRWLLRASRLDATGKPAGAPFPLSASSRVGQTEPALAWNGSQYLVAWVDDSKIEAVRVDARGTVLDATPIHVASVFGVVPAVGSDGRDFFVLWEQGGLTGARVGADGVVKDPGGISVAQGTLESPQLAFDGTNYLAVWTDYGDGRAADVRGARISRAGRVLDPGGIAIAAAASTQYEPHVTFHGDFLVSWIDRRTQDLFEVRVARVRSDGTVRDQAGIVVAADWSEKHSPRATFDGSAFVVTWQSGMLPWTTVRAARVTAGGHLLDPAPMSIWKEPADFAGGQDVATLGPGKTLVVYTRFDADAKLDASRVRGRS